MNQIANYSQTDWTLFYKNNPSNKILCKSGTINSISQIISLESQQELDITKDKISLYCLVGSNSNIYIFDSNTDSKSIICPSGFSSTSAPYVLLNKIFTKVIASVNISEEIIYPYFYKGQIINVDTYDLSTHTFGENIDKINPIPDIVPDPEKKKELPAESISDKPKTWIFVLIFIIIISICIFLVVLVYRKEIKNKLHK